ncbi:hypothetical protein C5167_040541 [Papaver somniferum]|uniref:Uncharacterized protein n=1 Tax=Papaver somniferum TaxID=3469 RepID=A0A4Y7IIR3_PAPSO|nr:hypothetical protein C5167_040541 [Papaver somniferum]
MMFVVLLRDYAVADLSLIHVLETPDGPVFESNAIARYGEAPLFFKHLRDDCFANIYILFVPSGLTYLQIHSCYKLKEAAIAGLKRALAALDSYLASNTDLVGHCVTLAGIIMT